MLAPGYIEAVPAELERLIRTAEALLLQDIARRISEYGRLTETAQYKYERMLAIRLFDTAYKDAILIMTDKSMVEIDRLFEAAARESHSFHVKDYLRKGIPFVEYKDNDLLQQFTRAAANETQGTFKNLTRTVGYTTSRGEFIAPREYFTRKLSEASTQVALGATTYDEAIKHTVKELAASGLKSVEYPYAKPWSLVAGVRTNVLTSVGALAAQIEDYNGEQLGMTLVETTAHTTSRESHQPWQGRRFSTGGSIADMRRRAEEIREADAGVRAMRRAEVALQNIVEKGILNTAAANTGEPSNMPLFDTEAERNKILNGTYPSRIQKGKQRKHIPGTQEFKQQRVKMRKESPGSEPSVLNADVNAQELIDKHKGTGDIRHRRGSIYPEEIIKTNVSIGKTWVRSMQKYVDTDTFVIVYSKEGAHIYPQSSV
jgi:hypothetical protein